MPTAAASVSYTHLYVYKRQALADADEASGIQLEAEAAAAYQKMAAAAAEDGVALVLTAGYQDADARSAAYETQKQQYLAKGLSLIHILTDQELGDDESPTVTELLNFVTELERIGDYAVNIMEKAEELQEKEASFSENATKELQLLENALNLSLIHI